MGYTLPPRPKPDKGKEVGSTPLLEGTLGILILFMVVILMIGGYFSYVNDNKQEQIVQEEIYQKDKVEQIQGRF